MTAQEYERVLKQIIMGSIGKTERLHDDLAAEIARVVFPKREFLNKPHIVDEIIRELSKTINLKIEEINRIIESAIQEAVVLANRKHDEMIINTLKLASFSVLSSSVLKALGRAFKRGKKYSLSEALELPTVEDILSRIANEKIRGLTLSERVWELKDNNIKLIEHYLKSGFAKGGSISDIKKDLKNFLKEPDKLYRRVRNDEGKLILSKAASGYNPGQGVYRSSYKNARRMIATEVNKAYRLTDHLRYKNNPFVVGFEVKLSGSHPAQDICDHLKGKYPKSFVFTGWHPQCFCYSVPVLVTDSEFDKHLDSILNDKPVSKGSANKVNQVPSGFKDWMKDNAERVEKMKRKPGWILDNEKLIQDIHK
jgi:hypothetical protein